MPPPTSSASREPMIAGAGTYPRLLVRGPTASLNENVAPGSTTRPSRVRAASSMLRTRGSPGANRVVNVLIRRSDGSAPGPSRPPGPRCGTVSAADTPDSRGPSR